METKGAKTWHMRWLIYEMEDRLKITCQIDNAWESLSIQQLGNHYTSVLLDALKMLTKLFVKP